MRIALLLSVLCFIALPVWVVDAHAQEQRPGFSLPTIITPEKGENLNVNFDDAFASIENEYLSDTIKLNYQISLLEKMVERQSELQKITDSYLSMGVSFDEPPPPKGICAQLPANAPCLKHYPELYDSLVDARRAYYDELEEQARAAALAANPEAAVEIAAKDDPELKARLEREAKERAAKKAARERETRYRWTEVSCSSGECQGVLIKPKEDGYRATVYKGSTLPDGTKVQTISASGIRVAIDGQIVNVRPEPGDSDAKEDSINAPLAGVLDGLGGSGGGASVGGGDVSDGGIAASKAAAAAVLANAAGGSSNTGGGAGSAGTSGASAFGSGSSGSGGTAGQTMAEPPLGPSGLF